MSSQSLRFMIHIKYTQPADDHFYRQAVLPALYLSAMTTENAKSIEEKTMPARGDEYKNASDGLPAIYNEDGRRMKYVSASETESSHLLFPQDMNSYGRLYGGRLLQWMDETAGLVAKRHSESVVVTAAIDNLQFLHGAGVHDTIYMHGYLTYVGRTSMEVRVDTYCEKKDGIRTLINRAFFVMVAVDEKGRPHQVPDLIIADTNEKLRWESAKKRQELRKMRQMEGF